MKKIFILAITFLFLFSYKILPEENIPEESIPEWLKRIEFSFQYETNQHPIFYFEMVQPLYQSEDKFDTFFYQPRVSLSAGDLTYNIGIGYRKIVNDGLLLGINLFGDYEDLHQHGRVGVGAELLGQILEARFNSYIGLTTKRVVESGGGSVTYERVADGLDFELGTPLPYIPWLKIFASGFWYDFDKFKDKSGWKARLEAKPTDYLVLEFYTWDDNKGEQEYGGKLECRIPFDTLADLKNAFSLSQEPFPAKDLTEQVLIPVERNFDIVVEKWTESANTTIEIYRGD